MNKPCAKCGKTVYPTEKLNCLDKTWHKACFRCQECGLLLNMKNYKGYDKLPYCNTHYPTTKFTSVAETPESRRIAENTRFQSQIKYHEQFEKDIKGKKIEVADDPETLRIRANMKNISQAAYHNVLGDKAKQELMRPPDEEKGKGRVKKPVPAGGAGVTAAAPVDAPPDEPANYERGRPGSQDYDSMPTQQQQQPQRPPSGSGEPSFSKPETEAVRRMSAPKWEPPPVIDPTQRSQRRVGSIADYDPMNDKWGTSVDKTAKDSFGGHTESYPAPSRGQPQAYYPAGQSQPQPVAQPPPEQPPAQPAYQPPAQPAYQPPAQPAYQPPAQPAYQPPAQPAYQPPVQPAAQPPAQPPAQPAYQPPTAQPVGGTPKFDPNPVPYQPPPQAYNPPPPAQPEPTPAPYQPPPQPAAQQPAQPPAAGGPRYVAVYDYDAGDEDEVSFRENDIILNTEPIDEGWMYGTVERTGKTGMLPSNYVERV